MHFIFILVISFYSVNRAFNLVMLKHLAMQRDISYEEGRLYLWELFMSISCFMLM